MPYRKTPIIVGQIYHIYNRSVAEQPIFQNKRDYTRALEEVKFYSYSKPSLRFSYYERLPLEERIKLINDFENNNQKQISLLAFCLMPNHVHFLIQETRELGIVTFMRYFQDSYAKYFNTKHKRAGALFQAPFKSVLVESDEQLLHVSRYIHLNPLTSYLLKETEELSQYPWSSFIDYLGIRKDSLVNLSIISNFFPSVEEFKTFN